MASDVESPSRRPDGWHELMQWWKRGEVLSICMDHGRLEEVFTKFIPLVINMCLRYFSKPEVITRLIQNFFFHEDLQFPAWSLED